MTKQTRAQLVQMMAVKREALFDRWAEATNAYITGETPTIDSAAALNAQMEEIHAEVAAMAGRQLCGFEWADLAAGRPQAWMFGTAEEYDSALSDYLLDEMGLQPAAPEEDNETPLHVLFNDFGGESEAEFVGLDDSEPESDWADAQERFEDLHPQRPGFGSWDTSWRRHYGFIGLLSCAIVPAIAMFAACLIGF